MARRETPVAAATCGHAAAPDLLGLGGCEEPAQALIERPAQQFEAPSCGLGLRDGRGRGLEQRLRVGMCRLPSIGFPGLCPGDAGAGQGLLRRALRVELQEPREHLVAHLVGPAVAPGLLLAARLFFVDLVVEEELAVRGDVGPAVGVENGSIHRLVQPPRPRLHIRAGVVT